MKELPWYENIPLPALLRHARATYGQAMRAALADAGYDDLPRNGLYVIGAMAQPPNAQPLAGLVRELGVSKQAAGQLVDVLVLRGYLERAVDADDRRKLTVTLTARGAAAAAAQAAARAHIDAELLARMGPDDIRRTRHTLAALADIGRPAQGHDD